MKFIDSKTVDPYFNLAAEEFLLRNPGEEVCMIWQSSNAVIAGKHQNILAEINFRKASDNNIIMARRITGGGAVYHDKGNINFSFIKNGRPGNMINFEDNIAPIIEFLDKYGLEAYKGPKNEIMTGGRKISGNAEHIYKNRLLHHGTLLFDSDLEVLNGIIDRQSGYYTDRSVNSNKSTVANIRDCLTVAISQESFTKDLKDFLLNCFKAEYYELNRPEVNAIRELAVNKYASWEWIFGWSPDYEFTNVFRQKEIEIGIEMKIHRGIIVHLQLVSESLDKEKLDTLSRLFMNRTHSLQTVRSLISVSFLKDLISPYDLEDLIFSFF